MIDEKIKKIVDQKIESEFLNFKNQLLRVARNYENQADGITHRLEIFINENKACFYKNYKQKLDNKLNEIIAISLNYNNAMPNPINAKPINFNESKDRIFLETYFLNNQCGNKTARALGIPRTTFHDWKKRNQELINSEIAQKQT